MHCFLNCKIVLHVQLFSKEEKILIYNILIKNIDIEPLTGTGLYVGHFTPCWEMHWGLEAPNILAKRE